MDHSVQAVRDTFRQSPLRTRSPPGRAQGLKYSAANLRRAAARLDQEAARLEGRDPANQMGSPTRPWISLQPTTRRSASPAADEPTINPTRPSGEASAPLAPSEPRHSTSLSSPSPARRNDSEYEAQRKLLEEREATHMRELEKLRQEESLASRRAEAQQSYQAGAAKGKQTADSYFKHSSSSNKVGKQVEEIEEIEEYYEEVTTKDGVVTSRVVSGPRPQPPTSPNLVSSPLSPDKAPRNPVPVESHAVLSPPQSNWVTHKNEGTNAYSSASTFQQRADTRNSDQWNSGESSARHSEGGEKEHGAYQEIVEEVYRRTISPISSPQQHQREIRAKEREERETQIAQEWEHLHAERRALEEQRVSQLQEWESLRQKYEMLEREREEHERERLAAWEQLTDNVKDLERKALIQQKELEWQEIKKQREQLEIRREREALQHQKGQDETMRQMRLQQLEAERRELEAERHRLQYESSIAQEQISKSKQELDQQHKLEIEERERELALLEIKEKRVQERRRVIEHEREELHKKQEHLSTLSLSSARALRSGDTSVVVELHGGVTVTVRADCGHEMEVTKSPQGKVRSSSPRSGASPLRRATSPPRDGHRRNPEPWR